MMDSVYGSYQFPKGATGVVAPFPPLPCIQSCIIS